MNWYEEEIKRLEKQSDNLNYKPGMIFYGSSSITLWDSLCKDFEGYKPVNMGFGGSTLEACVYYFKRVMGPFKPQYLVVYAGDNDIGDGKQPKQVLEYFEKLCTLIETTFASPAIFFISIKPSIARWNINERIQETNKLIIQSIQTNHPQIHFVDLYNTMLDEKGKPNAALYAEDGLHLNSNGYALWKKILLEKFSLFIPGKNSNTL